MHNPGHPGSAVRRSAAIRGAVHAETLSTAKGGAVRASERAYARLRADVLDGVLAPGAVLAEVEQSVRLGVSRTPVREAFARLLTDGLLAPLPGRGLVVTAVSAVGVDELYEVREALEEQAVRLAARRGDPAVFTALAARFGDAPALVEAGEDGLRRYYDLVAE
ncbi:GntR family transcriptional regulator, partial [Kineococcus sp. R8]|nr:GntR family transcriptional regulator [Kineococcus siccus]